MRFRLLPPAPSSLRAASSGDVIEVDSGPLLALSVLAWAVASVCFSVYLANFANFGLTYGSLGAAVGLLIYLHISASIVLAGVELNAALHPSADDAERARDPLKITAR